MIERPADWNSTRLTAIDALRGAVMVIMALDHARDFLHMSAMSFSPEDLTRTTPALFFTRWITHVCAPTFMFLAGIGVCVRLRRDGSAARVSRFLWTRGLWLIVFELTVMRLAMNFTLGPPYPILLLVLSALGAAMIVMAALIHLPWRIVATGSVAVILLHNTLDGVQASQFGALAPVWQILHQPGVFFVFGIGVVVGYPIMPWAAVMAAGFCAGRVFFVDQPERRRVLVTAGAALIVAFAVLRLLNVYGDPAPWSHQPTATYTLMSFLRVTKYPPSLLFLLMTVGPALLALAWLDARELRPDSPLVVIGRVPFFYYTAHFWLLHVLAWFAAWVRYGNAAFGFLTAPFPSMGGPPQRFPADVGFPLWVVYLGWISVVALLFPMCRRFARFKSERRAWWVSYL